MPSSVSFKDLQDAFICSVYCKLYYSFNYWFLCSCLLPTFSWQKVCIVHMLHYDCLVIVWLISQCVVGVYLSEWTHPEKVDPGPWGFLMHWAEEGGGPEQGPPPPPPAPHGGRRLSGSPGGPAGARRDEKEDWDNQTRTQQEQSRTAWPGLERSVWR